MDAIHKRAEFVTVTCTHMLTTCRIITTEHLNDQVVACLMGEENDAGSAVLQAGMDDIDVIVAGNDMHTTEGLQKIIRDTLTRCQSILDKKV